MKHAPLLAIVLVGCAMRPAFEDAPALGPSRSVVQVESRMYDAETARTTCYWKSREAGVRMFEGAPGCTFEEGGRFVILWSDPHTFTRPEAFEVPGHELYHRHNMKDHK